MARYVIDAPTLLRIVDGKQQVDASHQLVAPHSIRSEALRLLLREVRSGLRTEKEALRLHERITELKMRALGDRASRGTAWRIARQRDWDTMRDAEYLAVTRLPVMHSPLDIAPLPRTRRRQLHPPRLPQSPTPSAEENSRTLGYTATLNPIETPA